jgi:CheY-like chemotaxis protein
LTAHDRALGLRLAALRRGVANFVLLPAHPALLLRNLGSPVAPVAAMLGPARLLVVDDGVTSGNALAERLAEHGHDVVLAATAATAFEYLTLERPDLLLVDVFLPDSDGIELARTARAVGGLRHAPIVILTGRENTHVRQRALDASVSEFVAKNDAPVRCEFSPRAIRSRCFW